MNATIDLLTTRRSASAAALAEPGPTQGELEVLLTVASRVPDHGKLVPFRFIVFQGEARLRAGAIIAEVFGMANPTADADRISSEGKRLAVAPLVVAVVSRAGPHEKIPEWEQILTSGAVCMNLVIAANALGFAAAWLTGWFAYDRKVLDRIGLAANEKIAGFVHIGSNPAPRDDRPRPALADIVTTFGG